MNTLSTLVKLTSPKRLTTEGIKHVNMLILRILFSCSSEIWRQRGVRRFLRLPLQQPKPRKIKKKKKKKTKGVKTTTTTTYDNNIVTSVLFRPSCSWLDSDRHTLSNACFGQPGNCRRTTKLRWWHPTPDYETTSSVEAGRIVMLCHVNVRVWCWRRGWRGTADCFPNQQSSLRSLQVRKKATTKLSNFSLILLFSLLLV